MKLKIAVCDDDATWRNIISENVFVWADKNSMSVDISCFPSAEAFLFAYDAEKDFDILLLDIEMKEINGIELAKRVRLENSSVQIVFITGYSEFISDGYDVSALHYLMKPVNCTKLFEVLDRAVKNLSKTERFIIFTVDGIQKRIVADRIMSVESLAHFCRITAENEIFELRASISDIEKMLGDGFIRTHRSYLVGLRYIKNITKTDVVLDNGVKIPMSRNSCDSVNRAFIKYYRGEK